METVYKYYIASKCFINAIINGSNVDNLEDVIKLDGHIVGRPDVLSSKEVKERKGASKWKHALGQLICYRDAYRKTNGITLIATLELIITSPSDIKYVEMASSICKNIHYDITVVAVHVNRVNWRYYISKANWLPILRNLFPWLPSTIRGDAIYALSHVVRSDDVPHGVLRDCIDTINRYHDTTITSISPSEPVDIYVPTDMVSLCMRYYGMVPKVDVVQPSVTATYGPNVTTTCGPKVSATYGPNVTTTCGPKVSDSVLNVTTTCGPKVSGSVLKVGNSDARPVIGILRNADVVQPSVDTTCSPKISVDVLGSNVGITQPIIDTIVYSPTVGMISSNIGISTVSQPLYNADVIPTYQSLVDEYKDVYRTVSKGKKHRYIYNVPTGGYICVPMSTYKHGAKPKRKLFYYKYYVTSTDKYGIDGAFNDALAYRNSILRRHI